MRPKLPSFAHLENGKSQARCQNKDLSVHEVIVAIVERKQGLKECTSLFLFPTDGEVNLYESQRLMTDNIHLLCQCIAELLFYWFGSNRTTEPDDECNITKTTQSMGSG